MASVPVMLIVPAFETGRPSRTVALLLTVIVVVLGMVSVPLPAIVPPLQVLLLPVRAIGAAPLMMPPCIVSVGTETAPPLFSVSVPPVMVMSLVLVMELSVVVPPLLFVAPVMLYAPLTVFVPALKPTVPAPLMLLAASKVLVVV